MNESKKHWPNVMLKSSIDAREHGLNINNCTTDGKIHPDHDLAEDF